MFGITQGNWLRFQLGDGLRRFKNANAPRVELDVMPGGLLLPPYVAFRFEWQRRVLVDRNMLSTKYGNHDASKNDTFRRLTTKKSLHVRYLSAFCPSTAVRELALS